MNSDCFDTSFIVTAMKRCREAGDEDAPRGPLASTTALEPALVEPSTLEASMLQPSLDEHSSANVGTAAASGSTPSLASAQTEPTQPASADVATDSFSRLAEALRAQEALTGSAAEWAELWQQHRARAEAAVDFQELALLDAWNSAFHEQAALARTELEQLALRAERGDAHVTSDDAVARCSSLRTATALLEALRGSATRATRRALLTAAFQHDDGALAQLLLEDTRLPLTPYDFGMLASTRGCERAFFDALSRISSVLPRESEHVRALFAGLWGAVKSGNESIVRGVLQNRAVNPLKAHLQENTSPFVAEQGFGTRSPVFIAAEKGHVGVLRALLANEHVKMVDPTYLLAVLKRAAEWNQAGSVATLLALRRIVVRWQDSRGLGAHVLVDIAGKSSVGVDVIRVFLQDERTDDKSVQHALARASGSGSLAVVQVLLDDPRANPSFRSHLALTEAASQGREDVAAAILRHPRAYPSIIAVRAAACRGHAGVLRVLYADLRIHEQAFGMGVVGNAFRNDRHDVIDVLLAEPRFRPCATLLESESALSIATQRLNLGAITRLLADDRVSAVSCNGALHAALEKSRGFVDNIELRDRVCATLLSDARVDVRSAEFRKMELELKNAYSLDLSAPYNATHDFLFPHVRAARAKKLSEAALAPVTNPVSHWQI